MGFSCVGPKARGWLRRPACARGPSLSKLLSEEIRLLDGIDDGDGIRIACMGEHTDEAGEEFP
jgi:hypothetical protein